MGHTAAARKALALNRGGAIKELAPPVGGNLFAAWTLQVNTVSGQFWLIAKTSEGIAQRNSTFLWYFTMDKVSAAVGAVQYPVRHVIS